jgi:excisionase family DNA binding protein
MTMKEAPPRLLSAKEVAVMLGCSPNRVRRLVREGRLRSIRLRSTTNSGPHPGHTGTAFSDRDGRDDRDG